jgi:hypothetical protein
VQAAVDEDRLAGDLARALDQPDDGVGHVVGAGVVLERDHRSVVRGDLGGALGAVRVVVPGRVDVARAHRVDPHLGPEETLTIAPRLARRAGAQARVIWNGPTTLSR